MSRKIRPDLFRLGIIRLWNARWFPHKGNFKLQLEEDELIRSLIRKRLEQAGIVTIEIARNQQDSFRVTIKAAKPGLIIGRGGKGIEETTTFVEQGLKKLYRSRGEQQAPVHLSLNVEELKRTEVASAYIAQTIAWDLERRLPSRRVMKKALEHLMQNRSVKGAKITVAGRINGAEIARTETLSQGNLPLQTLRANIDYGVATANTTYGAIGIKVWIYKGNIFQKSSDQLRERNVSS
ncbi:MAG: 30S ribosomal protein S3 [Candidatus Harrisonbacteria bacterium CG10_big_fil_rev_8_21_14_0_10_42_17]|uniref:Small ribosomal subunit protein uS3 n=1 Tax=Candidatus Harrisonbacteria bacterium CG10_big_fil_rev_8_21_14_0_10_42_17 TaxID=1974584 RepID=A0A2M6WHL8_9BACT|nr:MAG: 30S ribosomal protein S3 [Candidatus Harrisonbacteria bacterium CG10_big_fil_rev_8_21_14_0_10_42_17]